MCVCECLAVAVVLAGCDPVEFEVLVDNAPEGGLWSAWGPAPDDVWVVGGQADAGVVLRGDENGFTALDVPGETPLLNWVHGTSASDVWVGGLSG